MPETIESVIDHLSEAWRSRDLTRLAALYAPDYRGVDVGQAKPENGPADVQETLARYLQAFPDLRFDLEETIIQGERAALSWIVHGTQRGSLLHIPPTGRVIEVRGVSILTVKDGQITQGLYLWDMAGLLREIGLLPEL